MSKVSIQGDQNGTGDFTIKAPNSNVDRTLNLPDEAGTLGLSDKIEEGNSSVEVVDTGTGSVRVTTDGSEVARFGDDFLAINETGPSSGEVLRASSNDGKGFIARFENINTSNTGNRPWGVLIEDDATADASSESSALLRLISRRSSSSSGSIIHAISGSNGFIARDDGAIKFNAGYGSLAEVYGCRAWVNFDGTGTVSIRESGNVSSITDNGTGKYQVNFASTMPDASYSASVSGRRSDGGGSSEGDHNFQANIAGSGSLSYGNAVTTTYVKVVTGINTNNNDPIDSDMVNVAIFR